MYLLVCLFICVSVYIYLSVCLFVYISIYLQLSIYLSLSNYQFSSYLYLHIGWGEDFLISLLICVPSASLHLFAVSVLHCYSVPSFYHCMLMFLCTCLFTRLSFTISPNYHCDLSCCSVLSCFLSITEMSGG